MSAKVQNGFSLIEVTIAMVVFSTMSLAIGTQMIQQKKGNIALEDQISKIQISRNIESTLKNSVSCGLSLAGVTLGAINVKSNLNSLKDLSGTNMYQSNTSVDFISIGQMKVTNISVPNPNSAGLVEIEIPLTMDRAGGQALKSYISKVSVTVDASKIITNCSVPGAVTVLETGTGYDNQTGNTACTSIGKTCSYVTSYKVLSGDVSCSSGGDELHCLRICNEMYNQSLPGVPNVGVSGTANNDNIHSCNATIGHHVTYVHPGIVNCTAYFSAVCN